MPSAATGPGTPPMADVRLMPLSEAATAIGVAVADLRTAMRHGQLTPVRLGRKFFVTESDLRAMVALCRVLPKPPASGSDPEADAPANGLSSTEEKSLAQAAALATAAALKKRSPRTSGRNTSPNRKAAVSPAS